MSTIPEWFWEAVDQKPESHYTEIDDIDLHYLSCCLLYTSPSPRDRQKTRMPSSA